MPGFFDAPVLIAALALTLGIVGVQKVWTNDEARARVAQVMLILSGLLEVFGAANLIGLIPGDEIVGGALEAVSLPTAIAFLMWVYRVYGNLERLGRKTTGPASSAIVAFFLPGANLILVPIRMAELWSKSHAEGERSTPAFVLLWWFLFAGGRLYWAGLNVWAAEVEHANALYLLGHLWFVFAAVASVELIRRVAALQGLCPPRSRVPG